MPKATFSTQMSSNACQEAMLRADPEEANDKLTSIMTNIAVVSALLLSMVWEVNSVPPYEDCELWSEHNIWQDADRTEVVANLTQLCMGVTVVVNIACTLDALCIILRVGEIPKQATCIFLRHLGFGPMNRVYVFNQIGLDAAVVTYVLWISQSYHWWVTASIASLGLAWKIYFPLNFAFTFSKARQLTMEEWSARAWGDEVTTVQPHVQPASLQSATD